jgi:ligand-binding sensor domain-containing protein
MNYCTNVNKILNTLFVLSFIFLFFACENEKNSDDEIIDDFEKTLTKPTVIKINPDNIKRITPGENGVPLPKIVKVIPPEIIPYKNAPVTPGISYLHQTAEERAAGKTPIKASLPITVKAGEPKVYTIVKECFEIQHGDTIYAPKIYYSKKQKTKKSGIHWYKTKSGKYYSIQHNDTIFEPKTTLAIQPKPTKALLPRYRDNASYNIQYLNIDQGMISSWVVSILEDRYGNLWLGTSEGLSRYDGVSFVHFTAETGLSCNRIWSTLEDSKGNLWFGTFGFGVIKYDGTNFTYFDKSNGLTGNYIKSIIEDTSGNIWIGTQSNGLSKYDGESFLNFKEKNGLPGNHVTSIIEDDKRNIWIGTYRGLCKYNRDSFSHFNKDNGLSNKHITSLFKDGKGNLWFDTGNGINKYDGESFIHINNKNGLTNDRVNSILEDSEGKIWFGTHNEGVYIYDGKSFTYLNEQNGLSNNKVWSMHEDQDKNIWIGTMNGGLNKYKPKSFIKFTKKDGLTHNGSTYIYKDKTGSLCFKSWNDGLTKFNGKSFMKYNDTIFSDFDMWTLGEENGKIWFNNLTGAMTFEGEYFTYYNESNGLLNHSITSFLKDTKGHVWFGTETGVCMYDGKSFINYTEGCGLPTSKIVNIFEDSKENIWFGTASGMSMFDGEFLISFKKSNPKLNHRIRSIFEDSCGNIWFGTTEGIYKYDGNSYVNFMDNNKLSDFNVRVIREDSQGNIWFGTQKNGVHVFNGKSFTQLSKKAFLKNNIWSIFEDNKKNIWLLGFDNLSIITSHKNTDDRFHKRRTENIQITNNKTGLEENYSLITLEKQDGLLENNFASFNVDYKNRAWWETPTGFTMLDLNTFEVHNKAPKIQLNNISLKEKFVDFRHLENYEELLDIKDITFADIEPFYNYPNNLVLPYNSNYITFHFSALDWAAPHKIRYSFMLKGVDNNWSQTTTDNKADYRNIPHGKYTFSVKAIGEAQIWSEPFEYTFTILPPWWHTWWARTGYVLALLFLIYGIIRWQTAKLKVRQKELESKVDIATHEIREQKENIEVAHKEIKSSINYARRIQSAILPPPRIVKEYLKDSFILYKPKDIVAGDFYWMEHKNNKVLFAAADCTGHGVPGAMVSVVCHNALNRSVREFGLMEPGEILDKTRDIVVQEFDKSEGDVKDGMDIALCSLEGNTLHYAGANNPLWIIRNGELLETKANKQPIGKYDNPKPYTTHAVNLEKGDTLYIFSDGYVDQFGGEKGKKFMVKAFRKLIVGIQDKTMEEQKTLIDQNFEQWKGELDQVDDVCVIGVRV